MTYIDRDYDFIAHPLHAPPNLRTWTMVIGSILMAFGLAYLGPHQPWLGSIRAGGGARRGWVGSGDWLSSYECRRRPKV